jgi:ATP-dependent RNA helicase RhlE
MLFEEFTFIQKVYEQGYILLRQYKKIDPLVLAGNDLIGCAQTGTGKQRHLQIPPINHRRFIKKKLK